MSNLSQYKLFIGGGKTNRLFGVTFSFKKVKADSCAKFVINLRKVWWSRIVRTTNIVLMVVPRFLNFLWFSTYANINTNHGKPDGKRDCDNCRQTSACNTKVKENRSQRWKVTRERISQLFFFLCYFRILERGSRRHWEKSQSQLCWSIFDFLRVCWSAFDFISLTLYFLLAQSALLTSD